MAGGKGGDDDFVERQGKCQHAARQQGRTQVGQNDVAEGLPAVCAQVHRGFDQALGRAAQAGDDVVVDDHHAEGGMADHDGEHTGLDTQGLERREQGDAGDDAGQGDRQDQHQRNAFLAEEVAPVQGSRGQRPEEQGDQGGEEGDLHRKLDRLHHVGACKRHGEPLQGKALRGEAERRVLGVEGVDEDDQDREVQEHQPAPGRQAQSQGSPG
ncbi:hypothetical protein D3C76_919340 [compost metagenome]